MVKIDKEKMTSSSNPKTIHELCRTSKAASMETKAKISSINGN
jgi:hypothetical protein